MPKGSDLRMHNVAALTHILVDAAQKRSRISAAPSSLIHYQRFTQTSDHLVVGLADGLDRLFSTQLTPRPAAARGRPRARSPGWLPLRHLAMRRGMGLAGDLPKLARGEAL